MKYFRLSIFLTLGKYHSLSSIYFSYNMEVSFTFTCMPGLYAIGAKRLYYIVCLSVRPKSSCLGPSP